MGSGKMMCCRAINNTPIMEITSAIVDDPTIWRATLDADKAYQAQRPDRIATFLSSLANWLTILATFLLRLVNWLSNIDAQVCLMTDTLDRVEQAQDVDNTNTNNRIDHLVQSLNKHGIN
jgi:hypothetical protein